MDKPNRRKFMQFAVTGAVSLGSLNFSKPAYAERFGLNLIEAGMDFSPDTGKSRKAIPSACWQCVTRDGIIGYVENGRLVKIEGNPALRRTGGKICARGQAGVGTLYNPDRLLYPLLRVGKRGEGKWKRISWDKALELVVNGGTIAGNKVKGIKSLMDEGRPDKFMFHYGRMKGSDGKIIKSYFLASVGTKTIGNHTSICESCKWTAHELTWGAHYDNWDTDNTNYILNFGSNVLEAHTNHIPQSQRITKALARGSKMVTFDVRLSNTAAKSTEWVPIIPGTDLAVVLAMCNVILESGKYDREFIENYTNVSIDELKSHFSQYTPKWASAISGVSPVKIRSIAMDYAQIKPSVCISYRGAVMHYNGVQAERAIQTLEALSGNIDVPGGRCRAVGAKWKFKYPKPKTKARKLKIVDGEGFAFPTHHSSHRVLSMIKKGDKHGERPDIYMTYCYNPVYVNGNVQENIEVLKNEKLIPFHVAVDVALSESTALADLVLPDTTYLERWAWDDMVCPNQVPEYYIRQPMVKPLGETRNFADVACDLGSRLGFDFGFKSAKEFVQHSCDNTPGVKDIGGFAYMQRHGAWYDKKAKPRYLAHTKEIPAEKLEGTIVDARIGVVWNPKKAKIKLSTEEIEAKGGFAHIKNAYKGYVGQKLKNGRIVHGFPPDKHLFPYKSGLFEIKSDALKFWNENKATSPEQKFSVIPGWMSIPEHQGMNKDEMILTTFKVAVQTHSRTQGNKWLTELYHENPAWINPVSAAERGIKEGGLVRIKSSVGEIVSKAHLTEGVVPGVDACLQHGHGGAPRQLR